MKNIKIILYILPLLVCLSLVKINSYAGDIPINWGNDVLNGTNGSANINSLLGDTYSFESLYSPGFVVGLSNAYDQINNTLYDKFGWDLDEAGQKIIEFTSGDDIGLALNVLASTVDIPVLDFINNGYHLYQFTRSGAGKSLVLGLYDNLTNTVTNIYNNALNFITDQDIENITSTISDLENDDVIYNNSDNSIYFTGGVSDINGNSASLTSNVYIYNVDNRIGVVTDNANLSAFGTYEKNSGTFTYTYTAYSINQLSTRVINGVTYYYGMLYVNYIVYNHELDRTTNSLLNFTTDITTTVQDIWTHISSNGFSDSVATSLDYSIDNNYNDIMALLDSLKGHWVDTNDMATIRDLLDGGVVAQNDTTGEKVWEFDDTIVDSLADIIDDILDKSLAIEDELEGVIDDSLPDNPDNPSPDDEETGIAVPPDYPTETFNTVNDIIRSPLEFFSIFEPIFMIFGSSALIIFGLWLFVPCVIIIGFIIWALK